MMYAIIKRVVSVTKHRIRANSQHAFLLENKWAGLQFNTAVRVALTAMIVTNITF